MLYMKWLQSSSRSSLALTFISLRYSSRVQVSLLVHLVNGQDSQGNGDCEPARLNLLFFHLAPAFEDEVTHIQNLGGVLRALDELELDVPGSGGEEGSRGEEGVARSDAPSLPITITSDM